MRTISKVNPTIPLRDVAERIMLRWDDIGEAYMTFCYKHGTTEGNLSTAEWTEACEMINVSQVDAR